MGVVLPPQLVVPVNAWSIPSILFLRSPLPNLILSRLTVIDLVLGLLPTRQLLMPDVVALILRHRVTKDNLVHILVPRGRDARHALLDIFRELFPVGQVGLRE